MASILELPIADAVGKREQDRNPAATGATLPAQDVGLAIEDSDELLTDLSLKVDAGEPQ